MNYRNPELLDRLAAEYVLGTLQGPARRRFQRLLKALPEARAAVTEWEQRLAGMADAVPDQTPPKRIWRDLERRIQPASGLRTHFWRSWALFATAGLVALTAFVFTAPPPSPAEARQVAFVNEGNAVPLWLVSMNFATGELSTRAVSAEARSLDQVYELWMLPAVGDPQSLGLMPVNGGETRRIFSPALLDLLRSAQGLAVSIEPAGGSPTGLPTGPVVYQAPLLNL